MTRWQPWGNAAARLGTLVALTRDPRVARQPAARDGRWVRPTMMRLRSCWSLAALVAALAWPVGDAAATRGPTAKWLREQVRVRLEGRHPAGSFPGHPARQGPEVRGRQGSSIPVAYEITGKGPDRQVVTALVEPNGTVTALNVAADVNRARVAAEFCGVDDPRQMIHLGLSPSGQLGGTRSRAEPRRHRRPVRGRAALRAARWRRRDGW
jgi:hypothetical protein